jgi:hypothetical protein
LPRRSYDLPTQLPHLTATPLPFPRCSFLTPLGSRLDAFTKVRTTRNSGRPHIVTRTTVHQKSYSIDVAPSLMRLSCWRHKHMPVRECAYLSEKCKRNELWRFGQKCEFFSVSQSPEPIRENQSSRTGVTRHRPRELNKMLQYSDSRAQATGIAVANEDNVIGICLKPI